MATVAKNECIQIERYELGPFGTNSYIMTCLKTGLMHPEMHQKYWVN
jgi:hypothetical protein